MSDIYDLTKRIIGLINTNQDRTREELDVLRKLLSDQSKSIGDLAKLIVVLTNHQEELLEMLAMVADKINAKDLLELPQFSKIKKVLPS